MCESDNVIGDFKDLFFFTRHHDHGQAFFVCESPKEFVDLAFHTEVNTLSVFSRRALGADISSSPVDVVRRVSDLAGGKAHVIFAPMVVDTAEAAIAVRRQTEVAAAMDLFDSTTVAVVSVGSWDPPNSQLLDALSPEDRANLLALGVQAEIAGILVTSDGTLVQADFAERCVSITAQQMYAIPSVVAVAGGRDMARAMHSVICAGLVSSVVIDRDLAEGILALPPLEKHGPMTD